MAEYDKIRINTMEEAAAGIIDAGRITPKKLAHAIRERAQAKLVQGANITIDNTDPDAPVISATGGGGGGAVDSVNGETGDVTGLQWQLTEGSGIDINNASPKSPVISANSQEILNAISATQGAVLFRGPSGWEALPPGTNTQYLKSGGPAANPVWQTPSGGGGGAWTVADEWDHAVSGNTPSPLSFNSLNGYQDFLIIFQEVSGNVSSNMGVRVSVDGGASYYSASGDYVSVNDAGETSAVSAFRVNSTNSTAARSGQVAILGANLNGPPKVDIMTESGRRHQFLASPLPLNGIQVFRFSGGNFTGGKVFVLAR